MLRQPGSMTPPWNDRLVPNFFNDNSPFLTHPLLTPERTKHEVDQLERILEVGPNAVLLDIGCGFGRHSIELAVRGHQPVGIDPSPAMIEAASQLPPGAESARFRVQRGQDLTEVAHFDGAFALFSTLGQVDESGDDNRALLTAASAALKPGGRFVVEVPNGPVAVESLVASDQFGDDTNGTTITRRFDGDTRCIVEHFDVRDGGEQRLFDLILRIYDPSEVTDLLRDAGFVDITAADDLAAAPGSANHEVSGPTMVFTARRP